MGGGVHPLQTSAIEQSISGNSEARGGFDLWFWPRFGLWTAAEERVVERNAARTKARQRQRSGAYQKRELVFVDVHDSVHEMDFPQRDAHFNHEQQSDGSSGEAEDEEHPAAKLERYEDVGQNRRGRKSETGDVFDAATDSVGNLRVAVK